MNFWGRKCWKDGRKELLPLTSLHNLIQRNYKMWQSWKWTSRKDKPVHFIDSEMSGVGWDSEHHPIQTPCSGQGQLKHVATCVGQILNISRVRDSIPSPRRLVQSSTRVQSQQKEKLLFLRFKNNFFQCAHCPLSFSSTCWAIQPSCQVYLLEKQSGVIEIAMRIILGKKHLLLQQEGHAHWRKKQHQENQKTWLRLGEEEIQLHIFKITLHTQEAIGRVKSSYIPGIVYGRIIQEKWRLKMQETTK